jgi:hypothetical protein
MELAHIGQKYAQNVEIEQVDAPVELYWKTSWDFFSGGSGSKTGYTTDLKETSCVLKTSEPIEFRRWIRMMIRDENTNVSFTAVGRVIRCENSFEASIGSDVTLYRYVVEFTYPLDLSLALSSKNLSVLSCRTRNVKSSMRPGFLA